MASSPAAKRPRSSAADASPEAPAALAASEEYEVEVRRSPVPEDWREAVYRCMCDVFAGDFASNGFGDDQLARMAEPGALYAVARSRSSPSSAPPPAPSSAATPPSASWEVAACAMIAIDGDVGLVGGVCTRPAHRRRGLSGRLISRLVASADGDGEVDRDGAARGGPRWLILGTGSRSAAAIYASNGFRGLRGSLDDRSKGGYNPEDEGEWIMLRDGADPAPREAKGPNVDFDLEAYLAEGEIAVERLARRHWAAACLLLNATGGNCKMKDFGIDDGLNAELRLAQAVRDNEPVFVAVHESTRRIYGLARRAASAERGFEVFCLGPASVKAALVAGATVGGRLDGRIGDPFIKRHLA